MRRFRRETHPHRPASPMMQRFYDNLPRISHIAGWGQRSVIAFRTQSGPSLLSGGVEMQPTNIVRYSEGQDYYRRSSGQAPYGGMSLPIDEMAATGEAMAGVDLTPPRDAMLAAPGGGNGDTSATTRRGWRSGGKKRRKFLPVRMPRGSWSRR